MPPPPKYKKRVETRRATNLTDIPEEVFRAGLFPCLRLNDLLRLRGVNKWAKGYSDDYLQTYPRSQDRIRILLTRDKEKDSKWEHWHGYYCGGGRPTVVGDESSALTADEVRVLKSFMMKEDQMSTIRMPVCRFKLENHRDSSVLNDHPLLPEFLSKYGRQIVHLEMNYLNIPMEQKDIEFYEKCPKLKSLHVGVIRKVGPVSGSMTFPTTFKELKKLTVERNEKRATKYSCLMKFLEYCNNLEYLSLPLYWSDMLMTIPNLQRILGLNQHKKFRFLELQTRSALENFGWSPGDGSVENDSSDEGILQADNRNQLLELICQVLTKFDVKLIAPSEFISSLPTAQLVDIADHIITIRNFFPYDKDVTLPSVESIVKFEWPHDTWGVQGIRKALRPSVFPELRKLEVFVPGNVKVTPSLPLGLLWTRFPNLEEVSVGGANLNMSRGRCGGVRRNEQPTEKERQLREVDFVFTGGNLADPVFLQLTKLKKLTLKDRLIVKYLTDDVFLHVFRHMKLREFCIQCHLPAISFTTAGIRSLLTGPFMETIEKFPFYGWSIKGVKFDEFEELAKKFPGNEGF